jgi:hypothetical protein
MPSVTYGGPAERCRQQKNVAAGKHAACRQKAEGRYGTAGDAVRLAGALLKCDGAFERRWGAAETTAAGACVTTGDLEPIEIVTRQHTTNVAIMLAGGTPPDCPGSLATCLAQLAMCPIDCGPETSFPLKTEQSTCVDASNVPAPCAGTGQDGETQTGLARLYADNGDGTIHDLQTGLVWEKLGLSFPPHEVTQAYSWANAYAVKIAALNTPPCLAGQCDWRLPNVTELLSLIVYDRSGPAVSPDFATQCSVGCAPTACSCEVSDYYWTSTTVEFSSEPPGTNAVMIDFRDGGSFTDSKNVMHHVRAVRGGA